MTCYCIDPLRDTRWTAFIERHPSASVFHTAGWLAALNRTYAYEPIAVTTCHPDQELTNAIVLCRVKSCLTGRRLVSLPFSDHCDPLVDSAAEFKELLQSLCEMQQKEGWRYVELRPLAAASIDDDRSGFYPSQSFYFHRLDLHAPLEKLMAGFHKDCVQRKIRRAEREGLIYEEGRSESLLRQFYALQLATRRRQKIPPQPYAWFRNLAGCLGDRFKIRVASLGQLPVASILTLQFMNKVIYKYGCSDEKLRSRGGTQLLFWRTIQEAKSQGMEELDMGRCDCDNQGLADFKERWGAARSMLTYMRYPVSPLAGAPSKSILAGNVIALLPDRALSLLGAFLYRHFG